LRLSPPRLQAKEDQATLKEVLEERAVRSHDRVSPRGVKRKMSNYDLRPRTRTGTTRIDIQGAIRLLK
jgi:hypothetical protein